MLGVTRIRTRTMTSWRQTVLPGAWNVVCCGGVPINIINYYSLMLCILVDAVIAGAVHANAHQTSALQAGLADAVHEGEDQTRRRIKKKDHVLHGGFYRATDWHSAQRTLCATAYCSMNNKTEVCHTTWRKCWRKCKKKLLSCKTK